MLWLRKSKKGFTLIELMVVVAIIAVLSLLGLRVYTGQATKARNASVQANVHSLATELGVIILGSPNPTYKVSDIETAATNAQITNPFNTALGEKDILVSGTAADSGGVDTPGQIYYSNDTDNNAYSLEGIGHDGDVLIDLLVNYSE